MTRLARRGSMFIVVTYDIADDRRRVRVAKCMEAHGRRVQWSVFDCLLGEGELASLRRELATLIDPEEDSVRFYRLCRRCRQTIDVLGTGSVRQDERLVLL